MADRKEKSHASQSEGSLVSLVSETILMYFFWSVFFAHIPAIWFGPMAILSATEYGEEFYYLVAYLSPLLLKSERIRRFLAGYPWIAQFMPLVGLFSLLMGTLRDRTLLVCFGTLTGMVVHWSAFWMGEERRNQAVWATLLGLVAFTSSRFAFSSVIPVWKSVNTTYGGFALGALAALVYAGSVGKLEFVKVDEKKSSFLGDVRLGLGFGVLVFLTNWILSSHGLFARWLDLDPFPVGILMVLCMYVGIIVNRHPFVRSWMWWLLAVLSAGAVLSPYLPPQIAIVFGLIVTTYVTSIWSVVVEDMSINANMARSLLIGSLLFVFGNLAIIWSVAYCFVPEGTGGPFMRERAGQVFFLSVILAGLGYRSSTPAPTRQFKSKSFLPPKKVLVVLALVALCVTLPAIAKRGMNWHNREGFEGMPTDHVRGMAWAIRFGYDNFGFPNFDGLHQKITEVKANTIILVETDTMRPFNTNWDVVEYLEENLHMYSDYGPSTLNETWGCALFSYFPILRADREVLPSPEGENACLIDATLDVHGTPVDVIGVHFGNTPHVLDRHLQAQDVAKRAKAKATANRKTVWLGYLTDNTGGPNYNMITDAGLVDVAPYQPGRYCIYLFHIGMRPENFKIVSVGDITDTDIQIADFYFPKK